MGLVSTGAWGCGEKFEKALYADVARYSVTVARTKRVHLVKSTSGEPWDRWPKLEAMEKLGNRFGTVRITQWERDMGQLVTTVVGEPASLIRLIEEALVAGYGIET